MSTVAIEYVSEVQLEDLHPHPKNPRSDLGDLAGLSASVKAKGILSPLLVATNGDGFTILAGHRRAAAAKKAGLLVVPAMVHTGLTEVEAEELLYMENLQHEHLTVSEQAFAVAEMIGFGTTVADLATRIGKSKAWVNERLKLMALPREVRVLCDWDVADGGLPVTEALNLVKYATDHGDLLIEWAKDGEESGRRQSIYVLEQKIQHSIDQAAIDTALVKLSEQGVQVFLRVEDIIAEGAAVVSENPENIRRLVSSNTEKKVPVLALDPGLHSKEPCMAQLLIHTHRGASRFEVCTAPANHKAKGESKVKAPVTTQGKRSAFEKAVAATDKANRTAALAAMQKVIGHPTDAAVRALIEDGQLDRLGQNAAKGVCLVLGIPKEEWPNQHNYPDAKAAVREYAAKGKRERSRALVAVEIGERTEYGSFNSQADLLTVLKAAGYEEEPKPKREDFDG
jgi:ParB/RepB/Spo0J family partition protein